jgi:hypothetical protein
MPDLTSQLLPTLQTHRLPGLDLGAGLIAPQYAGGSIFNLPASICRWLHVPEISTGLLDPEIFSPLASAANSDGYRRVILILMDALALHRLQDWMQNGPASIWRSLADDGLLAPLTSISPSTTSAALTTLWSGQSPSAHGIMGYEVWLKEYSLVANMILHAPITFRGEVGSLARAGFDPEKFLALPTLGTHLRQHGVTPFSFQHASISQSGLSRMFLRDVELYGFSTPADLWISLRQLLENHPGRRMYLWVYWGEVDHLSHHHGPDDERAGAEFAHFSAAFEQFFLKKLSPAARKDTLVLLSADHGQMPTPLRARLVLKNHPELTRLLHIYPTGENRLMYLYLRPGTEQAVRDYFETAWPGQFSLIASEQAAQAGLFGPSTPHPRLRERIGDLIAIAREDGYLWWGEKEDYLLGRHGGMSAQEMLVPLVAARL